MIEDRESFIESRNLTRLRTPGVFCKPIQSSQSSVIAVLRYLLNMQNSLEVRTGLLINYLMAVEYVGDVYCTVNH